MTKTHTLSGATVRAFTGQQVDIDANTSQKILAFLDQARTPYKASPVDGRIPPMLSPYTDSGRFIGIWEERWEECWRNVGNNDGEECSQE